MPQVLTGMPHLAVIDAVAYNGPRPKGDHLTLSISMSHLQSNDDLLQVVQGKIDVAGFFEDATINACAAHALTPSQVYEVQLGPPHSWLPRSSALNQDGEDAVGPRGRLIEWGLADCPVCVAQE